MKEVIKTTLAIEVVKMNKFLYPVLVLLLSSCRFVYHRAPHYLKTKGYTFRYADQSTNLSKKLNLNGYYFDTKSRRATNSDGGYGVVYFFDDGMVVRCVSPLGPPESSMEDNLRVMDSLRRMDQLYVYFNEQQEWGYYKLIGDTIKVQFVKRPELGGYLAGILVQVKIRVFKFNQLKSV
ncbi:hypothetical protein WBG78_24915 [Chryseolinea sp. T2]|uniref:hypothetical protein n=1 Tax=Chryseolinea sp. T2 TaxID=3129255 RepID=UPI00307716B9